MWGMVTRIVKSWKWRALREYYIPMDEHDMLRRDLRGESPTAVPVPSIVGKVAIGARA